MRSPTAWPSAGRLWTAGEPWPSCRLGQLPSSPLLEEFGWRGLALPILQSRWNALGSSVLLGLVWGLWHLPLMMAHRDPLVPYLLLIVPHTVLMTWVVNSARGSMLLAMLFHAGLNTALTTLSVGSSSVVEILLTWLVAVAVVLWYGPRELAPRGHAQLPQGGERHVHDVSRPRNTEGRLRLVSR